MAGTNLVDTAVRMLDEADALVIAAGAGMGVDSGLPDFRGDEGFWRAYPALGRRGLGFMDAASPQAFHDDPRLAWGFYGHRLELYRRTVPHEGFAILKRWAARMRHGAFVFTSNVDGQFQKAGMDPGRVHECHGSIHWLQCLRGCHDGVWPADRLQPDIDADACQWRGPLPACPQCGGLARPNILMFGDGGWQEERYTAQQERLTDWLENVSRPVVVELGAGTHVPSVRWFATGVTRRHGGRLLRINPRECAVDSRDGVGIAAGALDALRALDGAWGN